MAITRTLILNTILLCLPPIIILGVFKFFFVQQNKCRQPVPYLRDRLYLGLFTRHFPGYGC